MSNEDATKKLSSRCSHCSTISCHPKNIGTSKPMPPLDEASASCPMRRFPELIEKAKAKYDDPSLREFARLASVQEFECYEITDEGLRTKIPRLEETMQLAAKCNYKRIGIAFCTGLKEEARMVTTIFEAKGFEVVSVNCKVGRVPKESIGITEQQKIGGPGIMEAMCNPIGQAEVLNKEKVDFAVMIGLCVGHDSLFLKQIEPPVTVLAVKDRVLGHNPLAAAYLSKGPYYGRLRRKSH